MATNETIDKTTSQKPHPGQVDTQGRETAAGPGQRAQGLLDQLRQREDEFLTLMRITERVSRGVMLTQVLESLYQDLRSIIPYRQECLRSL
jgi:hypothetical protein